ncbi:MAG: hypothetical protein ACNA7W_07500 [Pseudomonadales bacterium]
MLIEQGGGGETAFWCPVAECVTFIGFGFGADSWHPFVALLKDHVEGRSQTYEGSLLERYYQRWQPIDARATYAGFEQAPASLAGRDPHLVHLVPWTAQGPEDILRVVRAFTSYDNRMAGKARLDLSHGMGLFGPTHPEKGRLEFERLISIYRILKARGYDRSFGDICVVPVKRRNDLRFIVYGGGFHRACALAALGHEHLPARFLHPFVVDVADVDFWPQVRNGTWSREEASAYVDYLFDFDCAAWARTRFIRPSTRSAHRLYQADDAGHLCR